MWLCAKTVTAAMTAIYTHNLRLTEHYSIIFHLQPFTSVRGNSDKFYASHQELCTHCSQLSPIFMNCMFITVHSTISCSLCLSTYLSLRQ